MKLYNIYSGKLFTLEPYAYSCSGYYIELENIKEVP
jgi:hypothetical protein